MLHLTNGDATSAALREAGIPGEIHSVDDILMEGPLRNGLAAPQDLLFRAAWLEKRLGIPKGDSLAMAGRRARLARLAAQHDEVTLWSEEDLFCQVNLAHFLTLLAPDARATLAAPAQGHVATLAPDALRELHERRRAITPQHRDVARRVWAAFLAPDPTALASFAPGAAWPALAEGIRMHLRRFPGVHDGLSLIERWLLNALAAQPQAFAALFGAANRAPELAAYGFGDLQVHALLRAMAEGGAPLVFADDPRALQDAASPAVWSATDLGRDILDGKRDAVDARGLDAWLGGVHLVGARAAWRWDEAAGRLVAGEDVR